MSDSCQSCATAAPSQLTRNIAHSQLIVGCESAERMVVVVIRRQSTVIYQTSSESCLHGHPRVAYDPEQVAAPGTTHRLCGTHVVVCCLAYSQSPNDTERPYTCSQRCPYVHIYCRCVKADRV